MEVKSNLLDAIVESDIFGHVCGYLSIKDILKIREVSSILYQKVKSNITIYEIGLDKQSYSKWDGIDCGTHGWGMIITVDQTGTVSGSNRNIGFTDLDKTYKGSITNGVFKISVNFQLTGQENEYTGKICQDNIFRGNFKVINSGMMGFAGATGTIEGTVTLR